MNVVPKAQEQNLLKIGDQGRFSVQVGERKRLVNDNAMVDIQCLYSKSLVDMFDACPRHDIIQGDVTSGACNTFAGHEALAQQSWLAYRCNLTHDMSSLNIHRGFMFSHS
jgi:hypothetical protein